MIKIIEIYVHHMRQNKYISILYIYIYIVYIMYVVYIYTVCVSLLQKSTSTIYFSPQPVLPIQLPL